MATAAQEEFNQLMRDKTRRNGHPEDEDDAKSFLDLSDDGDDAAAAPVDNDGAARSSFASTRHTIPRTRYGANTGPKGVISDAQNFRDSIRVHRKAPRSSATLARDDAGVTLGERLQAERIAEADRADELDDYDGENCDDMDDDFMARWRQGRLRELQSGAYDSGMHGRGKNRRLYGDMATVDAQGYLDAVEGSPADTVVIVYVYDDLVRFPIRFHRASLTFRQSQVSQSIEDCLKTLAAKHQDTRFVRFHYQDAEMEPAGVPGLIAYRGGEKFAALVPVVDELPDDADLSSITMEAVLRRYVVPLSRSGPRTNR